MVSVNIRELVHNFSKYLKEVKEGEQILVMERNVPVAELVPHNPHVKKPGWKREIKPIKVKGESFSQTVIRNRREEKY